MKDLPTEISRPSAGEGHCPSRVVLWIDGVGGFLVCLGSRVTIGHAAPDTQVDIPVLGDISKHHATIQRDPECCYLEAVRKVQVNGQPVEKAFLRSGDRITLGQSCQLVFTQAVPASASARLNLVSGHRFWQALDGVLLMAETLVLGPGTQTHVPVRDLKQPLLLYRHKEGIGVRYPGQLAVNGAACQERALIEPGMTVATEDLCMTLEMA